MGLPTLFADTPLVEFVHVLSPQFQPPYHLREWCEMIEACLKGGVRGLCSIPIRHHKTMTTLHGVAWLLVRKPDLRIILMCADHERALELGKVTRRICEAAGVGPVRGDNTIVDWKNEHGGGVVVMSAEQSRLGRDVDVLIFDDPITEQTASDASVREAVDVAIAHYAARAGRPGLRGSVLGVMSRWNDDDPIGRRAMRKVVEWRIVQHAAIVDIDLPTERAFAADVMTLEEIKQRRAELREVDPAERLFWAQFMNNPRASVDARFRAPMRYDILPTWPGFRYGMGVDLGYTPGEGDWFAVTSAKFYGSSAYMVDVMRERADFNVLENMIRSRWEAFGRCPIFSYIAGPEKGAIRYFADKGIPILGMPARYNKATRAQTTIDRWNAGKVLIPLAGVWVPPVLTRFSRFTGSEKEKDDDEIDAAVAMCDGMLGSDAATMPRAFGQRRM